MFALLSHVAGGPETLTIGRIPDPEPDPGNVVVKVAACGVNYPDYLLIQDLYQVRPDRPFSPGAEAAGVVTAVGNGVTDMSIGDRVLCRSGWGGMAEYLHIGAERCFPIPDTVPFVDAVTFLFTYSTVLHALRDRCQIRMGEKLLVLGASGGIGTAAIDLGREMGARVFAAASSEEKLKFALARGCESGVVYSKDLSTKEEARNFTDQLKKMLGTALADVIVDPVGGPYCEAALRAIAPGGRLGIVGFTAGIAKIPMNLPLLKSCQIVGVDWRQYTLANRELTRRDLIEVCNLYLTRRLVPAVTEEVPFDRAAEAINRLGQRDAIGKLIVLVDPALARQ